jgi:hypothetical protein
MLFELALTGVQTPAPDADTETMSAATSRRLAGPLDDLLRALLPADAPIAVVTAGDPDLPSFPDSIAVPAPNAATKARFLVIPASDEARLNGHLDGWSLVTRQRYLGEVWERRPGTAEHRPRPADKGLWRRLINLFRR